MASATLRPIFDRGWPDTSRMRVASSSRVFVVHAFRSWSICFVILVAIFKYVSEAVIVPAGMECDGSGKLAKVPSPSARWHTCIRTCTC